MTAAVLDQVYAYAISADCVANRRFVGRSRLLKLLARLHDNTLLGGAEIGRSLPVEGVGQLP